MEYLQGVGPHFIDHPDWIALEDAIADTYRMQHSAAFFTICSHAKPYSKSAIHDRIREALYNADVLDRVDYIHISSAGIIPAEAEMWATHYDWNNACIDIDDELTYLLLRRRIQERLSRFLYRFPYGRCFFYLRPESNTWHAVKARLDQSTLTPSFQNVFIAEPVSSPTKRSWRLHDDPDDVLVEPTTLHMMTSLLVSALLGGVNDQ